VLDELIKSFQDRVKWILNPVLKSLDNLEGITETEDPIKGKITEIRKCLAKVQQEAEKMSEEIKRQQASCSWKNVAIAWAAMNQLLEGMQGLRTNILSIEIEFSRRQGNRKLGRILTAPMASAQCGPVVRTECEEVPEVRISFNLLLQSWSAKFCRSIAATINPTCRFQLPIAELEMVSRFDSLLNQCGPLQCGLYDEENINPDHLAVIESDFKALVAAQGVFCNHMMVLLNGHINCEKESLDSCQSSIDMANHPLLKHLKMLLNDLTNDIEKVCETGANKLTSSAEAIIVGVRAVTKEFKEVTTPILDLNKNPRMAAAFAEGKRKEIPEVVLLEIQKQNFAGKFPTTDSLFKLFNNTTLRDKLIAGRHGVSRASFGLWLKDFKTILNRNGIPAGEKRIVRNASSSGSKTKPPTSESPEENTANTELEKYSDSKATTDQESDENVKKSVPEGLYEKLDPSEQAECDEENQILKDAINKIPDKKIRDVMLDKHINDYSPVEIAVERLLDEVEVQKLIANGEEELKKDPKVLEVLKSI
jgi:DNA-directed RNA polymerase specialized sigma24 family protein